ncbi:MAG: RpiB/LacA/LacB family sugar-phosphate isomerase, partial [Acidimicrobiia bacterium]
MRVAIAADHAGYELKQHLAKYLAEQGHAVFDLGTHDTKPVDYPDTALAAARA